MTLGELIALLKSFDKSSIFEHGFHNPHSYRGDYAQLAFEPRQTVSVAAMLADAESAIGAAYKGYKGGEYVMSEWTDVNLALYGGLGHPLMPEFFEFQAEIASLRARLAEAEKASPWRTDMENAPKDGSQILISCGQVKYYDEQGYGEVEFAAFNGTAAVRWTDELDGCWVSSITRTGYVQDAVIHKPEYWMRLPVPPQPSGNEAQETSRWCSLCELDVSAKGVAECRHICGCMFAQPSATEMSDDTW